MAPEYTLRIQRQEGVMRGTVVSDLYFKARLELWQNIVGVGFQRNDRHVSRTVEMTKL